MNRIGRIAAAAGAMMLLSFGAQASHQQAQESIRWHTDKRKAFDEARRTGKPLWVLFR